MYHPGYVESCHRPERTTWYRDNNHTSSFCDALQQGDYIPCGASNDNVHVFYDGKVANCIEFRGVDGKLEAMDLRKCKPGTRCCCFVFGRPCDEEHLQRRWTCCGQTHKGPIQDMVLIRGCRPIYNQTDVATNDIDNDRMHTLQERLDNMRERLDNMRERPNDMKK